MRLFSCCVCEFFLSVILELLGGNLASGNSTLK